ncbi:isoleucine--tRNA ligase [Treponema brennaborense]|uniref:Isoleucine--tRNA ligase n=1 Tax=Treponema brennaborense (strain DSM 12168 / CIP 105900 / DD5/3) TaxID=906968 RepID=F4LP89_TREBD|nr:isoleucine--tRNA ligase [Treponema brennaborense]AEE16951.1 Isoleucyl-tRNA synthetase [Treponema brennaborense DSM 12168]
MYEPVDPKASFPELEEKVLKFWKDNDIFKKSIAMRDGCSEYVFYDGPPFATGLPHFGHFIPSTIKDIIPRYQTMKGKKVERRFGWDCHGLPVENLIEKELGLNSKTDIEKYGVAEFNEACRASVLRYVDEWKQAVTRLGRWVDFDNDYKTMNPDYMESIWWILKSLWEKGLLYEGHYILPYCPRCSTVLSNHELALGGYKDVHDPAVTIRFKVTQPGEAANDPAMADGHTYLLAWTTTPWTLPSNLGLTMGPDIDYVKVKDGTDFYILAESRLAAYYKSPDQYELVWRKKGSELVGTRYEPLFPYFANLANASDGSDGNPPSIGAFRVFTADFVSTEDGTGIVHTAPGFGEDDNKVFKGSGVPTVCPVDNECKFTAEVPDYAGRFVKDCDKDIMERLKTEGKLVKRDQILHAYPHCWRCSSPLIYRAVGSWFVGVESIRDKLLKANYQITWQPEHIKNGRFGKWLEGARDWAISRNRYWGNPIPVWKCPDCGKTICVGSRRELEELSGTYPEDLHKHFVDKITIPCECGGTMSRIPEVLDCWFESGSMPYAQNHYPFENKEYFEAHFPADFISEGLDQTRGWFYSLTVLAAALFDRPAFKNCVVNGLVLASDGKKMSKSLRNYTDPAVAVNTFGADAIRLFLMHSAVVKADDLKYSDEGVRDVLKSILIPLWNSYSFYITYANIDGIQATGHAFDSVSPTNPLDRWLLSITQKLVTDVSGALDAYDLSRAIDPIVSYIDQLNNWYIRRSRRRFWKSENDGDKTEAYETLYLALKTFSLVAAPVVPFITEIMWQNLRTPEDPESVHLADYPAYDEAKRDLSLEFKMETVQKAVSMGRSLRYQFNLKIRQPLKTVEFVTRNPEEKKVLLEMEESIREELNVKKVVFHEREDELVEYKAKANFRTLGKELGPLMKAASAVIAELDQEAIQSILDGSTLSIDVAGRTVELDASKIIVDRLEKAHLKVVNDGTLTVALDSEITDDLRKEGYVRDLIRGVQNLRKESGLSVTDRIVLTASGSDELKEAYAQFADFIAGETLAVKTAWASSVPSGTDVEAGEQVWSVAVEKA